MVHIVCLLGSSVALIAPTSNAAEFFVATNGNDQWSGGLPAPNLEKTDGPFASIKFARDAIRTHRQSGASNESFVVYVRGGTYEVVQTLTFEAQDSGTASAPVIYRGYREEQPVLVGGRAITDFVSYRGKILKAELGSQGLKGIYFRQLFFDGQRQHLARYPNFDPQKPHTGGWAYADGAAIPLYTDVPGEDKRTFTIKREDVREWACPENVEVFVFARYNWRNDICPLKSIDSFAYRVTLAQDASYSIRLHDRYFFQNAIEELDAPGEWYLDRRTATLFFWPPSPMEGKRVVASTTRTMMELGSGTAFLTVSGFRFECAEGTAIVLRNTTNCLIAGNTIRNVGDYSGCGVSVSGGFKNGVVGNDISDIGNHGITIGGGDRKKLEPAENYASNNYIHHVGAINKHGVGISLGGVGNRASHNLIHDGPRMGIMFSGNNLVIEYNHIRHMSLETEDTAAIYTGGRDWISSRGTVIRYNYIHDMFGYGHDEKGEWHFPYFAWGIYLDDNAGGVDVIGNIVARCSRAGLHLHNGRDNRVQNNIFAENGEQQIQYSGWTASDYRWIKYLPEMVKTYRLCMQEPAWTRMRNMSQDPATAPLPDGKIMTGNEFLRNIIYYSKPDSKYFKSKHVPFDHNIINSNLVWHYGLPLQTGQNSPGMDEWASWQLLGLDRDSVIANPLFLDSKSDDYRLHTNSPAFKLGFKAIPLEKIGPYPDDFRASWPIIEAKGIRERSATNAELSVLLKDG